MTIFGTKEQGVIIFGRL